MNPTGPILEKKSGDAVTQKWRFGWLVMLGIGFLSSGLFCIDAEEGSPPLVPFGREFSLNPNEVVVFLGGENVVTELETCHLESLLTAAFPARGVRFRNMGWEGDTVFSQPREVNYPPIARQLQRVGATMIFAQFGTMEALRGRAALPEFIAAYEKLLEPWEKQTPRIVLLTPLPYEKTEGALLPDLSKHNEDLQLYSDAIRDLAKRHHLMVADVFTELGAGRGAERLTRDGMHATAHGQAKVALAVARQLGLRTVAERAGKPSAVADWHSPPLEQLRQAIIAKNRLWFDSWRPTNWAFLGGDRTNQPSSHDHRDPKKRWFPEEMKQFDPRIEAKEKEIEALASQIK